MARDFADTFDAFAAELGPAVRPEGTLERLRAAFGVDVSFEDELVLLRPFLRKHQASWSEKIIRHMLQSQRGRAVFGDGASGETGLGSEEAEAFVMLYRAHARRFAQGAFDAAYLDSLEQVALFMVYHDVKSVWLAGAYQQIAAEMVARLFADVAKHRDGKLERLIVALHKAIAIETNQLQRVFTLAAKALAAAGDPRAAGTALSPEAEELVAAPPWDAAAAALVQESWAGLGPLREVAMRAALARLVELDPALRARGGEIPAPADALLAWVDALVAGLEQPAVRERLLDQEAHRLAPRGGDAAARLETGAAAALWALERAFGSAWTPGLAAAWRVVVEGLGAQLIDRRAP